MTDFYLLIVNVASSFQRQKQRRFLCYAEIFVRRSVGRLLPARLMQQLSQNSRDFTERVLCQSSRHAGRSAGGLRAGCRLAVARDPAGATALRLLLTVA